MASTLNLLRLLADPTRLRLLLLLEQEELSVAELQQILGMGQSRISSHLAQLKRAGVRTLLELLAKKARKVIAIDNSPKMVEFGGRLAKKHGFKNLEYRLGDIEDPPVAKNSIDLAILSQALHHAIHPERAVAAARRMLKRGGRLVILDLLSHRFERARELYADHWLGFSEVQLHQFLEKCSFRDIEISVVSREGQSPYFQTVFATGVK